MFRADIFLFMQTNQILLNTLQCRLPLRLHFENRFTKWLGNFNLASFVGIYAHADRGREAEAAVLGGELERHDLAMQLWYIVQEMNFQNIQSHNDMLSITANTKYCAISFFIIIFFFFCALSVMNYYTINKESTGARAFSLSHGQPSQPSHTHAHHTHTLPTRTPSSPWFSFIDHLIM